MITHTVYVLMGENDCCADDFHGLFASQEEAEAERSAYGRNPKYYYVEEWELEFEEE